MATRSPTPAPMRCKARARRKVRATNSPWVIFRSSNTIAGSSRCNRMFRRISLPSTAQSLFGVGRGLAPALATVGHAEIGEHGGEPDRRADSFHDRHPKLFA